MADVVVYQPEVIASYTAEVARLGPYDYRSVMVPLYTRLSGASPRGDARLILPSNQMFRVQGILPHVVPTDLFADDSVGSPFGNFISAGATVQQGGTIEDFLYGLAHNCRIDLRIETDLVNMFPRLSFPLSDLWSSNGDVNDWADSPMVIPAGTTLNLNLALQDTTDYGGAVEYGVVLFGQYIRAKNQDEYTS